MRQEPERPNPDTLLAHAQAEEQQQARGKLKIFLGYVAGVGKTYAMLGAAHQRQAEGMDVVVGYVETHGRLETEELVEGLEVIPRRQVEYHGVILPEMDVDAVLARRPQLALVDELAHTNAPGSRHPKRYQDVEELLAAGIDVYTTLNIQHLESLNDVVAQITGITVRETVPDRLLDAANEIELIDYTFETADPQYLITFASFLIVGLAISTLASQAREQAEAARQRAIQTATLYALSQDLAAAVGLEAIMQAVITHIGQTFDREVAVFLPEGERLVARATSPGFALDEDKYAVATWTFRHGQPAGRGTDTLPAADARYLPLKTAHGVIGVLGLKLARSGLHSTPEQRRLMEAFASQTALAIERAQLAETARHAQLLQETENVRHFF